MATHKHPENTRAFEVLVREHHRRALAYALSLVRREGIAEDLVQDAFLTAYQNLSKFDSTRDFGSWLRGIVRMKYLEWTRRHREQAMDNEILDVIDMRHSEWEQAGRDKSIEVLEALQYCLNCLQEIAKQTIEFFYMEKLRCAEIAGRMETTQEVVRKRLERARRNLFHCIQNRISANEVGV